MADGVGKLFEHGALLRAKPSAAFDVPFLATSPSPRRSSISALTEITVRYRVRAVDLSPTFSRFVLHWGEMGARWGVNRTVAQIHALLYLTGRPMHADELCETLDVARSNVSTSLRELHNWAWCRLVHLSDDRRDHYETSTMSGS
jgi:hypothetical protein